MMNVVRRLWEKVRYRDGLVLCKWCRRGVRKGEKNVCYDCYLGNDMYEVPDGYWDGLGEE